MAFAIRMSFADVDASQYLEIHRQVIKSDAPKGLILHTAGDVDGNWEIFDIWETPAAFEAFSKQLLPVIAEVGITAKPLVTVTEIYNVWSPTTGLSTLEKLGSDPLPATVNA